ncbi:MAG: hypothetical protein WBQ14_00530 [Gaiellaceae bacterium]
MSDRVVVNPGDLESTAKLMGIARGDLQLLARRVVSDDMPEMPASITAQVRTGAARTSATLFRHSNELEQVASDLHRRARWAELTSAYELKYGVPPSLIVLRSLWRDLSSPSLRDLSNANLLRRLGTLPFSLRSIAGAPAWIENYNTAVDMFGPVAVGDQLTLSTAAEATMYEHFPTWNNGWFGTRIISSLPEDGRVARLLSNAARVSPFLNKANVIVSGATTVWGGYETFNDIRSHKGGEKIAVDATGTVLSGSMAVYSGYLALTLAPPPVLVGIVVAAAIAWGSAEAWQHRKAIEHVVVAGSKAAAKGAAWYWEHTTVEGLAWHYRHDIGHVLNDGKDIAASAASSAYDTGKHVAGSAYKEGKHLLHDAEPWHWHM